MRDGLLDESYLTWLYAQVGSVKTKKSSRTYWTLLEQLHRKEFVWFVPNDDNRVEDGRDLRREFVLAEQLENVDQNWMTLGCSMLEMLVALSRRLSFQANGEASVWFWHLIDVLGLHSFNDRMKYSYKTVDDILETVIWRTYNPDGRGGLFPLRSAERDQRKVEIWYQMSAFLIERM